ncbi:MAG: hypothetical protein AAGC64_10860, partial [Bacteroidota bacterium]
MIVDSSNLEKDFGIPFEINYLIESFAKLDFWFKSRLSEFQKRSLLVVNEAFKILSNEELGQKAGFSNGFAFQAVTMELAQFGHREAKVLTAYREGKTTPS